MAMTLAAVQREIRSLANPTIAEHSLRFFKTGPGQYGEGDRFLGLRVPELRRLTRKYSKLDDAVALEMLKSDWHEERLLALMLMVYAHERADDARKKKIHQAYLTNTQYVNNWDLVDSSAQGLVGSHVTAENFKLLERLARSKNLWERRIAIVATQWHIRQGEPGPTLRIAELLLHDREDLIHKAVGWMLREVGKRDQGVLNVFLRAHSREMPRTMLRYAIERHPEPLRQKFLTGSV
jgi:3-methyladenine DNA glycosylase AlkD